MCVPDAIALNEYGRELKLACQLNDSDFITS